MTAWTDSAATPLSRRFRTGSSFSPRSLQPVGRSPTASPSFAATPRGRLSAYSPRSSPLFPTALETRLALSPSLVHDHTIDCGRPGCKVCGSRPSNLQLRRAMSAAERSAVGRLASDADVEVPSVPAAADPSISNADRKDLAIPYSSVDSPAAAQPPVVPRSTHHAEEELREMQHLLRWIEEKSAFYSEKNADALAGLGSKAAAEEALGDLRRYQREEKLERRRQKAAVSARNIMIEKRHEPPPAVDEVETTWAKKLEQAWKVLAEAEHEHEKVCRREQAQWRNLSRLRLAFTQKADMLLSWARRETAEFKGPIITAAQSNPVRDSTTDPETSWAEAEAVERQRKRHTTFMLAELPPREACLERLRREAAELASARDRLRCRVLLNAPPHQPAPEDAPSPLYKIVLDRDFPETDDQLEIFKKAFRADVASLTGLETAAVVITSVDPGSTVVTFSVLGDDREDILDALGTLRSSVGFNAIAGGVIMQLDDTDADPIAEEPVGEHEENHVAGETARTETDGEQVESITVATKLQELEDAFQQLHAASLNRSERLAAEQERQRQLEVMRLEWDKAAAQLAQRVAEVECDLNSEAHLKHVDHHLDQDLELEPVGAALSAAEARLQHEVLAAVEGMKSRTAELPASLTGANIGHATRLGEFEERIQKHLMNLAAQRAGDLQPLESRLHRQKRTQCVAAERARDVLNQIATANDQLAKAHIEAIQAIRNLRSQKWNSTESPKQAADIVTRASECDLEAVTAAVHAFVDSLSHDGEYLHHYFAPLDERAAHNEVDTGPCSRHPHHQAHLVVKTQLLELCEGHSNISPNEVMLEVEELRQRRIAFVKEIENEVEKVLTLAEQREQTEHEENEHDDSTATNDGRNAPAPTSWTADPSRRPIPTPRAALTSTTTVITTMVVKVPEGSKPGETTIVVFPSGKEGTWTIPLGAKPGDEFTISEEKKTETSSATMSTI